MGLVIDNRDFSRYGSSGEEDKITEHFSINDSKWSCLAKESSRMKLFKRDFMRGACKDVVYTAC